MSIFRRAILHVARKPGKTALLFAILLVMATLVLTGLSIQQASDDAQTELRQALGGTFDIFVDWEESPYVVREEVNDTVDEETGKASSSFLMYSTVQMTSEDIAAIRRVPGVRHCSARLENLLPFDRLSLFPGTIAADARFRGHTKVLGVCDSGDDELFTSGTLALTEGRHISMGDTHVAVISEDLAERNGLKVGDALVTHAYDPNEDAHTGKEVKVEVIGLFKPGTVEQFGDTVTTYDKMQNRVFVDLQTSLDVEDDDINYGFSAVRVSVDDPQDLEQVADDVLELPGIDWQAFAVQMDNEAYEEAAAPLTVLDELVSTLLLVIITVSAVILALVLTLWTRSRVHEIGVLLSIGVRKSAIVGQYLVEVVLVAALAFGLSWFTSNAVAGQIGGYLLARSAQSEEEAGRDASASVAVEVGGDDLAPQLRSAESGLQVVVRLDSLAELYLIGMGIVVVAVGASSIVVMRLKPREIMVRMS